MKWLILLLTCMATVSCIERLRLDDIINWLEQDKEKKNDCDRGLLFDICQGVRPKARCSPQLALNKLLLLSELAGYNVNRAAVRERTALVVEDIHRLAKKANHSSIGIDLECFQKSICSVSERNGFRQLAGKTRRIASNIKTKSCHNPIDEAEYVGIYKAADFLDTLGVEMHKMSLKQQL
ncbi:unnamed protein product [Bursaphelenchus xylophilus]|uniref:(pine wood nematode) hypothetical protein n=1 Tax=Bursaphelenchus xylophilus TaxID=6326 RepID=A0A1I7RZ48_BURXY|nr:unnamed protein product [Bursaphelenchus xylophilus]CAG9106859.1 unnamed protein product [Bursaphelenchus xylophilus]